MGVVLSQSVANNPVQAAVSQANAASQNLTDSTQERFMTLLVTQLRNQDPLNPMDNAQVTSQIAQLSTVNGITQLNNTLLALSGQMDVTNSMQAANLIGKEVLVPGEKIRLGSASAATSSLDAAARANAAQNPGADADAKIATPAGIDLLAPAASVKVDILDGAGQIVRTMDLGALPEGVHTFTWDGKDEGGAPLADGAYTFKITALNAEKQAVPAQTLTSGKVSSVAYASNGLRIDLGLDGSYSLLDIRKIM